jgi:acylphosphatase
VAESTKRILVFGRVQGVAYRAWAVDTARAFAITGWVRNRRDGSVEALLVGSAQAVADMVEACRRGPPGARVERIEVSDTAPEVAGVFGFRQMPTI